ncbi:MAG: hypothetical protein Q4A76_01580, partial [Porphyromonadaceae bacterium]|nr:hypothetical protein [Porphyromonadaceae bacterium]
YTLLAVGIDPKKMVPTTDLAKFDFKTKPFEIVDPCKFDISFSDVTTTGFTFTIVPSSNKTRYYYGICPAEILEKEGKDQVAEDLIRVRDNHGEYDWSRHNALTVNKIVVNTDDMRLPAPLKPNKPYAIVVFGVNDLGARTTEVECKIQRTNEAKPLDMTFEFELLKQTEQGAILKITPSIKTAPYMVGCIKKQQYSQYVGKDDEFISYVIKSANIETVKGDCTLDKTHKLISDTEYVCFAFGYDGAPTTKLCTFPFRTGKMAQEGNLQMKLKDVKVEPSTSDVSKATVTFIVEPQEGVEHWSAQVFQTENGVVVGRFGVTLTDNEVAEYLFNPINKYKTEDKKEIKATVDWDTEVTCYSIAIDKSGKKGPLTKFKYVVKKK